MHETSVVDACVFCVYVSVITCFIQMMAENYEKFMQISEKYLKNDNDMHKGENFDC